MIQFVAIVVPLALTDARVLARGLIRQCGAPSHVASRSGSMRFISRFSTT